MSPTIEPSPRQHRPRTPRALPPGRWRSFLVTVIALIVMLDATLVDAAPPVPTTQPANPAQAQLSSNLAKHLRELDRDQSRRLSGAADRNTPQVFRKLGIPQLQDQVDRSIEEGPLLVVVGVRGPRPNSAFEIDHAVRIDAVAGRPSGRQALRLPQKRQAYERVGPVDSATIAELAGLLAAPASASNPRVSPTEALAALTCKRCAAFLAAFSSSAAGSAPTIASLVLLPDSVQIDIVGNHAGLPEPEVPGMPSGSPQAGLPRPRPPATPITPSSELEPEPGTEYPPFDPLLPASPPYDPGVQSEPEL